MSHICNIIFDISVNYSKYNKIIIIYIIYLQIIIIVISLLYKV